MNSCSLVRLLQVGWVSYTKQIAPKLVFLTARRYRKVIEEGNVFAAEIAKLKYDMKNNDLVGGQT